MGKCESGSRAANPLRRVPQSQLFAAVGRVFPIGPRLNARTAPASLSHLPTFSPSHSFQHPPPSPDLPQMLHVGLAIGPFISEDLQSSLCRHGS